MRLHALVPAAGRAERFGSAKLLARWQDQELLGHVLQALAGARAAGLVTDTLVTHRPADAAVRALALAHQATPVALRDGEEDLSDSLRSGMAEVQRRSSAREPAAVLICLADQPLLRIEVIRALRDAWRGGACVAVRPSYRESPGEPGHPLLLDRTLWRYAAELRGDRGFGPVLEHAGVTIRAISVGGQNPDIDTPEDLAGLDHPAASPPSSPSPPS